MLVKYFKYLLFLLAWLPGIVPLVLADDAPSRVLRVVGDDNYPPFLFRDPAGRTVGYVADWWRLWEQKTGVKVELKATQWSEAQQIITMGGADAIDNIFRTPQRESLYDFTPPYAKVPVDIFAHSSISGVFDIKGLKGFQIGAMEGDACIHMLQNEGVTNFRFFKSYSDLVKGAIDEDVKIFCMDEYPANYYFYQAGAQKTFRKAFNLYEGKFHRAVRKGDVARLRLIEQGAAAISADEDRALREKWLKPPPTDYKVYIRYLVAGASVLAVLTLLLVIWLVSTRALIRRRTADLRSSEERYRQIFEHAADAILICGMNSNVIAVNEQACRQYGYSPEDFLQLTIADIDAPEDVANIPERISRIDRDNHAYFEAVHRDAEGHSFPVDVKVAKILYDGKPCIMSICRDISEQKKTEDILRNAYSIIEFSNDAIISKSIVGIITSWNPAAEVMFGYTAQEAIGHSMLMLIPEGLEFEESEILAKIAQGKKVVHFETSRRHKNGNLIEVSISISPIFDNSGNISGASKIIRDITARKMVEEQLKNSEERFRKLFEDTKLAITLAEDGRFIAFNKASLAMLHVDSADQFIGLTPVDFSPEVQPDGRLSSEKVVEVIRTAFEEGSNEFEWEHIRADGEHFIARVLLTPIRIGDRELLHVVWSDITAQKTAEKELQEAQAAAKQAERNKLFRTLFDSATVALGYIKGDHIESINKQFSYLFGYEKTDIPVLSEWFARAYPDPEYRQLVWHSWQEAVERAAATEGKIENGEYRVTCKDGKELDVLIGGQLLEDGLLATVTDITAMKQSESALKQAKEAAEAANRAKSTFLANMSHELRTPMNAIIGFANLAASRSQEPRTQDYLKKIDRSSKHLLQIINDILDISKIEAERLTLEKMNFRLGEVVENIAALTSSLADEKKLALRTKLPPDLKRLQLMGDPNRLRQILLNYLGNAIKFTHEGNITLSVSLDEETPNDVSVRFAVHDTGIGISSDDQKRLFTAFEQADATMTRKYGGTGLGLAISKKLAEMMGGTVGVESIAGTGSTFWFTAQISKAPDAGRQEALFEGGFAEDRLIAEQIGARVLLVEDEPINQEVSLELLKEVGLNVELAEDGEQALVMAKQASYDLILMDLQMPRLNGIDATRAIRALSGYERTPILAMTANVFEEDRQRCLEAGMNDHIAKPIDPDKLYETLLKWLSTRETDTASGKT